MEISLLTKLLEFSNEKNKDNKERIAKTMRKSLEGRPTFDKVEKEVIPDSYKYLLQSSKTAQNNSTLVQEEVHKTVIEGAEPFKCLREILPIIKADSYSVRFVKGEAGSYAEKVSEGGTIDVGNQIYSKQDITIDKWGTRPLITKELIEDSLFDVVQLELKKAGARMENALNRQCLYQILSGSNAISTNSVDPGASTKMAVRHIAQGIAKVKTQNYMPDILVTHPHAEGSLLEDSNLAYVAYAGTSSPLTSGQVPKIMGLTPYTCTVTEQASSPTWDNTDAGTDKQALMLSKSDLGVICMRRDMTTENYEDPIHDLIGMAITMRFGTDVLKEQAGCYVTYRA